MEYRGQRIGVFVDIQNLYYSAKHLFNAYVNFQQIIRSGAGKGQLVRAIAYGVKAYIPKEERFFGALKEAGFEVKLKNLQVFPGGMKKGDWDVGIVVDIIRLVDKLDVVVLASGDGDYLDLVEFLQNRGIYVVIFAFSETASAKLIKKADLFVDMGSDRKAFLLKNIK
ncbi:NYN domain-containing protein [bacterium]|nr:NYN domain-containing protein [bacterium]